MADEHADRTHGQGAESAPRDVEPFWADEPETPVHGRAVPLGDRTPPVGMVQVEPGVFRPADGVGPTGAQVPTQRTSSGWPAESPGWPVDEFGLPVSPGERPAHAQSAWAQPPGPIQQPPTTPVQQTPARPTPVQQPPAPPAPIHQAPTPPVPVQLPPAPPTPVQQTPAPPAPVQQTPAPPAPVQQTPAPPTPVQQTPVQPVLKQVTPPQRETGPSQWETPPRREATPPPVREAAPTPPPSPRPVAQQPAPAVPNRQFEEPGPARHAAETAHRGNAAAVPPQQSAWPGPVQGSAVPPPVHTTPLYTAPNQPTPPRDNPEPPAAEDPFQELNWLADNTPTAEEFAKRRLARPQQQSATMGARAMLQNATFGLLKMAPGQYETEYKQDVEMVRRNFGGLRQVTVVNPKGGAGKTVAVLLLAMTFGQKRGGYVLAWDNNETQGTLGMRAQQDFHARTVRDMMRDLHLFQGAQGRVGDLSQYVRAQGEGMFDVLASDESATAGEMLTANSFAEIRDVVSRFYKLIFVDTGNNVRAENWQASMDATDQLVITMSARNDSAETAARMLDHLEQGGRRRLVRQAVTIVTMPPTRKDIDLQWIQQHFAARTRAVLVAPYERLIDSGEPIRYGELSTSTKDAWLKIAAAVASGL
ncbi:chromosome partitioning protein [Actinoplanes sp. G11-F43]|uniref:MinD/ParA family ATP-binding protein n=1 Tax=Actinoplanes sp. G11-F43 TaxID=3424130 RepID=UPI003D344879